MKGLKPPYIVLATHHAFMDFVVTPLALFPHRANYVSELEGFEHYGEWLYRQIGCLGTRKFVNDLALIKNIKRVIDRKGILVLYPEARYANVGTASKLPESVGKLVKNLKVPVVTLNMSGNYLQSPIWNLTMRKKVRLQATMTQLYTGEQLRTATVEEINHRLGEALAYDEYRYQLEQKMKITYEKRAKGLEKVLYCCPNCRTELQMKTEGCTIFCEACGERRYMTEYGRMVKMTEGQQEDEFSHIPSWYEWQRRLVEKEIREGSYHLDCKVRVEALPNAKNFIDLGEGRLEHTKDGFYLTVCDYGKEEQERKFFASSSMISVHTECDFRNKGQCITLSDVDQTYFIFPVSEAEGFQAVKIQFATEYLYQNKKANRP